LAFKQGGELKISARKGTFIKTPSPITYMHHQDSEFLVYKLFSVLSFLQEHRREGREWKERRERRKERRVS
jgi:hypothetical protein